MRTATGPIEHVVVVGAGLAGLSAALRLAGAGRRVTVCERGAGAGGSAGMLTDHGYQFDLGPTVLTLPGLLADALACVGEELDDWLDLLPLDPAYQARFHDGSVLDTYTTPGAMAEEIRRRCGPADAAGYLRFVDWVSALYRHQMRAFIDRNTDSPLGVLTPELARLAALGAFRRLSSQVGRFFVDPRLRRLFSFQSLYAGVAPDRARALYGVISYMDTVAGVSFPRGGMHAVPRALAGAADKHGVEFRYGTEIAGLETRGGRARAVITTSGERLTADAVVLAAPGLHAAGPRRLPRLRHAPSCFLLLAGCRRQPAVTDPGTVHHTMHFGRAWRATFHELTRAGRPMTDPSFLVTRPTLTDPTLAPADRAIYYVLFPTPNLDTGALDWHQHAARYREHVLSTLEASGYRGFASGVETAHVITPHDWLSRGHPAGSPFGPAHTLLQTGPFRPGNLHGANVVSAGAGTRPGIGVPMVMVSGRLAAERLLGPDPHHHSRVWP